MYCVFTTSKSAAVADGVYDKMEDLQKVFLYQNNLIKNYELELK